MRTGSVAVRRWVVVLLVTVSACGAGTLPKAEYAERAASICAQREADLEDAGRSVNPESGGGLLQASAASSELRRRAIAELRDLGEPDADADVARAMIAAMEEQVATLEASTEALSGGDAATAVELIEEAGAAGREARRLAEEFGIAPCAR